MTSIWDSTILKPAGTSLPQSAEADVVVIGAGLCGILIAYYLQQEGKRVLLVEADTIGSGQTHCTTAKITAQHALFLDKLVKSVGYSQTKQYADANRIAIQEYERLIRDRNIDCSFEKLPACLYTNTPSGMKDLQAERSCALTLGIDCEYRTEGNLPFPSCASLSFAEQAQFNPLPFLYTLANDLTICTHTKVVDVDAHTVLTDKGNISCGQIVFACHFPFLNYPGLYFMRMHQERSYVIAADVSHAGKPGWASSLTGQPAGLSQMYYGIDEDGLSLRQYKNYMLLGGSGHRTGTNYTEHRYAALTAKAQELWPGSRIACTWSAQDCMPLDGVPYIGPFSSKRPDWYVATGFKKWGMTTSMAAALILKELLCGRPSPYADVFAPNRPLNHQAFRSFRTELSTDSIALGKQFLTKAPVDKEKLQSLACGEGRIFTVDGHKTGVYRDAEGSLHAVTTRCPHLGCQLNFNPEEKTWDCPCHGSRFDYTGQLLDGPARHGCSASCPLSQ